MLCGAPYSLTTPFGAQGDRPLVSMVNPRPAMFSSCSWHTRSFYSRCMIQTDYFDILLHAESKTEVNPESWTQLRGSNEA